MALGVTRFAIAPMYRTNVMIYVNNTRAGEKVDIISGSNLETPYAYATTMEDVSFAALINECTDLAEFNTVGGTKRNHCHQLKS